MRLAARSPISPSTMFLAAAVALGFVLVACTSNTASSQSAGASGGTVITLSGLAFSPTTLTIKAGSTVTFQNKDAVAHTVTNGKNGKPDANPAFDKSLPAGQSIDVTFSSAGTFNVTCKIHTTMNMAVTVQ